MEITGEQLGIGGSIVVAVIGIVFKRAKSRDQSAGERSTEFWEKKFEELTERAVRLALSERNEQIRRIVREELERTRWPS